MIVIMPMIMGMVARMIMGMITVTTIFPPASIVRSRSASR